VADPELYNMGRTVEGFWEGAVPQKKRIFTRKWWVWGHSKMTFYVYAKIGQVKGGAPGSATAFQK